MTAYARTTHVQRRGRRMFFGAHLHTTEGDLTGLPEKDLGATTLLALPTRWPVRFQGERGTCVALAATACAEYTLRSNGTVPTLSAEFLHAEIRAAQRAAGIASPRTWLREAADVLNRLGICTDAECPYDPSADDARTTPQRITEAQLASAQTRRFTPDATDFSKDRGKRSPAAWIAAALARKKAVAMTIPVQPMPAGFAETDNWNTRIAQECGIVADPDTPWNPAPDGFAPAEGHAVCIVGYVNDGRAVGGGRFIVRNSWGMDWASELPSGQPFAIRELLNRGYGAISVGYVDTFCSELMTLDPVAA